MTGWLWLIAAVPLIVVAVATLIAVAAGCRQKPDSDEAAILARGREEAASRP